ncbi:hypothetical protein PCYB_007460 [Plasmodium cynomolgi strain B]|uniref:CYIR protein n=1 Tax=Plasmodium cynomolgi (strain B) TaxID=1120755 RepID=K6VKP8_PLACD|nr:hypothetical protein PCYB_007460 [Plasmodium cynomolgi strain B]GAB69997.1 hypothetical protein PCYB_007460 [Plasmodium cynomolgi strain B]
MYRLFQSSQNELYSDVIYYNMDRESGDLNHYDKTCSNINVNENKEEMIRICKKLLRNLENFTSWFKSNTENDDCILLNYWVYSRLVSIWGSDKSSTIMPPVAELHMIWNDFIGKSSYTYLNNKCEPDMKLPQHVDWRKRKQLYDYYVDYKFLVSLTKNDHVKCKKYYGKIEDMISVYKYFEDVCTQRPRNCPIFYNQCKPYNPKELLPTLICYNHIAEEKGSESTDSVNESSLHNPTNGSQIRADGSDSGLQSDTSSTQDTHMTPQRLGIGAKVTNSVLGAAQVLVTGTLLYRSFLVNKLI